MGFHHELRVRYAELDMQGVVFNAHYLAFADDAMSRWLAVAGLSYGELGWDCMVVHADLDWRSSARLDEILEIECSVRKWGTTSFVAAFEMHVGERAICLVELTYVGIAPGTAETMAPPDEVKRALDAPAP